MRRCAAAAFAAFLLCSCGGENAPYGTGAQARQTPAIQTLLARYMPAAMQDGIIKIAVVRYESGTAHTRQFPDGCVSEGRSMGFTVDTFIVDDEERCLPLIAGIAAADYDGLIFSSGGIADDNSNGSAESIRKILKPALERLAVVCFTDLPVNSEGQNETMPGLTVTTMDYAKLSRRGLEYLVSCFRPEGVATQGVMTPARPPKVIRAWFGPGIPHLDTCEAVYRGFLREGRIQEAAFISPPSLSYAYNGTMEALAALLPKIPIGGVDAIWAPGGDFARGCVQALADAGRHDIKLVSIDISNETLRLMTAYPDIWLACAGVDPGLIGIVNMRVLAAKLAGENVPDSFSFDARILEASRLDSSATMGNIAAMDPGWALTAGLFDGYPWMEELKAAVGKYQRIPAGAGQ